MTAYQNTEWVNRIACADALSFLKALPDESINTVVTSPSYFGLRDYGTARWEGGDLACDHQVGRFTTPASAKQTSNHGSGTRQARDVCPKCGAKRIDLQIGQEDTLDAYVAALTEIFHEARRVLRSDGNLFLNLGDSYAANRSYQVRDRKWKDVGNHGASSVPTGLQQKDLLGVPWRVAFALQADGWILRSAAPWIKVNVMPSSATDRITMAHEYIFHFVKSGRYYFDSVSNLKPYDTLSTRWDGDNMEPRGYSNEWDENTGQDTHRDRSNRPDPQGRNRRSSDVYLEALDWQIAQLQAMREARVLENSDPDEATFAALNIPTSGSGIGHYATFPETLIEPLIAAGCPERVCVACGKPHQRQVKRTAMKIRRTDWGIHAGSRTASSGTMLEPNSVTDLGFAPTCSCDTTETRPGVVLDMFAGSGTTLLVARRLGRNFTGCDLNPEYVNIAKQRLSGEIHKGMRKTDFAPENASLKQTALFDTVPLRPVNPGLSHENPNSEETENAD